MIRIRGLDEELDGLDAVAVKESAVESMEELELAYHLARKTFAGKKNIARKFKYEFLLWLSGTRDIKNAMKKTAPEEGKPFLLIVFSGQIRGEKPALKKTADALRLEKISLSRI